MHSAVRNATLRPEAAASTSRCDALRAAASLALAGVGTRRPVCARRTSPATARAVTRGRLRQSVSRWCYQKIAMPDLCKAVAAMGVPAIDLLEAADWPVVREFGLVCSMGYGGGGTIRDGLNNPANHDAIVGNLTAAMPKAATLGVPNLITFFGNRAGRSDREAIENCVTGLNRLKGAAEQHGVTICVELLNSKVNHPDYHGDRTAFGVEVVKAVGSPRVKLLYDIYHMQIMEGDVIRTIREHHGLHRPLPHRRRARPPRARRDPGAAVARRSAGRSSTSGSPATWPTSSCRRAIR